MAALDKVSDYLLESRRLLQDQRVPYRYPDADLVDALNIGLLEARRLRADLFLPQFEIPYFAVADTAKPVPFEPMYRQSLVYYMVGRAQLRDEEETTDARAAALLTKFTGQLLTIQS
jgi:Family of unknown function (DUF6682)